MAKKRNYKWLDAVRADEHLSFKAKHVAWLLGHVYLNFDDLKSGYPGVPNLVRDTGLSPSSVQRGLDELCAAGYLRKVERGRTGRATVYEGIIPGETCRLREGAALDGARSTKRPQSKAATAGRSPKWGFEASTPARRQDDTSNTEYKSMADYLTPEQRAALGVDEDETAAPGFAIGDGGAALAGRPGVPAAADCRRPDDKNWLNGFLEATAGDGYDDYDDELEALEG